MGILRERCILLPKKIPEKLLCHHMDHWVRDIIEDYEQKETLLLILVALGLCSNSKITNMEILE